MLFLFGIQLIGGSWRMVKICFIGAGSTVFVKNVIGDIFLEGGVEHCHIALYDIDAQRLDDSIRLVKILNTSLYGGRAHIQGYAGVENRRDALRESNFVINAIQVGGYEPATVRDFEIPKKYGIRQTIADTLGIGGIFRGLRTIYPMQDIAEDMEAVCPEALLMNYSNPLAICTGTLLLHTPIRTVGLCHSVQRCASELMEALDMEAENPRWHVAGINHMAWLLSLKDGEKDIYPEVREKARAVMEAVKSGEQTHTADLIRLAVLCFFGYYTTESSEHNAEYTPWWIKSRYPELIEQYKIPLDEYPRRCREQIGDWEDMSKALMKSTHISHERTIEYAADIIRAHVTGKPEKIHGNVLNAGHIENLPDGCVVEIPCLVDDNGIQGVKVGKLPTQCAALNSTNINVHELTIEAARTQNRSHVYQAAALDPMTAAELSLDDIQSLCDDMFDAHRDFLPEGFYKQ